MLTRRQKLMRASHSGVEEQNTEKKHQIEHSPNQNKRKIHRRNNSNDFDDAKLSSNNPQIQNGIVSTSELKACYDALKHVLTMKYVNVSERLYLTFPAKCLQSLKACSAQHTRTTNIPMSDNIIASQTFLKMQQPLLFIHSVSMDVVQNKFPGRNALSSLFELILCINDPSNDEYKVENVIDSCAFTISNILGKFPPCWRDANMEYRDFIKTTKKNLILGSSELLDNRTLFADIIHGIENVIQAPKNTIKSISKQDSFNDSLNDSIQLLNFHQFETKHAQKFSFDNQKREEKINRLFLTLSLFNQLFETDLAMWTIKNLPDPSAKISTNLKNPLIGLVLWANGELTEVNFVIKNILKLYINYISIDFPNEYTKILGRLVNMIYSIFELREIRPNEIEIDYPQSVQNQSLFCDAFTKIIFDTTGCNVGTWHKIIKEVEHPKLKLHLITALLTKIDHKSVTLNPKTIYFSLKQIESEFGDDFDEEIGQNNNIVKTKGTEAHTSSAQITQYPYNNKVNRRAASELTAKQHVELHLTALNSYIRVFHIKEFQEYWKNYEHLEKQKFKLIEQYTDAVKTFWQEPAQPFDLAELEQIQKQAFAKRIKKNDSPIYTLDVMNEESSITKFINIKVNVKMYRDDLKFCDMITTGMPKLHAKFDQLFPQLN